METSLSVQNDAILKSARRWIMAYYICLLVVPMLFAPVLIVFVMSEDIFNNNSLLYATKAMEIIIFLLFVFIIITGLMKLKKHSLLSMQVFAQLTIIQLFISFVNLIVSCFSFSEYSIYVVWGQLILSVMQGYVCCMSYSALWKNRQINMLFRNILTGFTLITFFSISLIVLNNLYIIIGNESVNPILFSLNIPLTNIVYLICFKRLLAIPSAIPSEEENELPYSYRPARVEIGYIVSLVIFIVLNSFLFV